MNFEAVASTFALNRSGEFANTNAILIPLQGAADPYPSVIVVSNHPLQADKVTVWLNRLTHSFPPGAGDPAHAIAEIAKHVRCVQQPGSDDF